MPTYMPHYQLTSKDYMHYLFLLCLFLILPVASASQTVHYSHSKNEIETITLQLKWFHQFQFAGYYAAQEKGFYQEEGLDVTFIERTSETSVIKQVVSGAAQYGIEDSGILVPYAKGEKIKAFAAIFQHSPFIFASKQSSGIVSPYEMIGKRIMFDSVEGVGADEVPLRALFAEYGIKNSQYTHIKPSFNFTDLAQDKVDVMSGYITDLPYYFKQQGIKINIINPLNYGIDFYGDLLFTSERELREHPGRADRFRRASLKGWQYALAHPEEIIQLIYNKYHSKLNLDLLRYEAKQVKKLIMPDKIPLGEIKPERLKQVANIHAQLKLAPSLSDKAIADFVNIKLTGVKLTETERLWLQKHPTLSFSGSKQRLPYESFDKNDAYMGIVADYLALIKKRLGISIETFQSKNRPELINMAKQGGVDIISDTIGSELEGELVYTQAFHSSPIVIVMHKDESFVENISQISHKRIVLIKERPYSKRIMNKYPKLNIHWVNSIDEGLTAVSTSEADALIACLTRSIYEVSSMGLNNVRVVGKTEFIHQLAFGIQKNLAPLVPLFNRVLDSVSETEKRAIVDTWGEEKYKDKIDYRSLFKITAIALCLIFIVIFWNRKLSIELVERRKVESKLKLASTVYQNTTQAIMVTDVDNLIVAVNPAFTGLTGYTFEEIKGKNPKVLASGHTSQNIYVDMWRSLKITGYWQGEIWNTKKNGDIYAEQLIINTIFDDKNEVFQRVGLFSDITEKKLADEKIWKQANFDLLTQLPNRNMFGDRLRHEIKVSQRTGKPLALLFLDLDHFKEVNDALGHDKGDQLLMEAAKRIHDCVRDSDTVARLGGDEFTVILAELDDTLHVERIAHDIIASLNTPFTLGLEEAYVSSSIGIALYPNDTNEVDTLIKYADQAMYLAKENGRNQFSFFTGSMQVQAQYRHQLMIDLHFALNEKQFELHYQPIIDLHSGDIVKAEALLRWKHPTRGMVGPTEFIPLAEESGLIVDIGNWVFQEATRKIKDWQQNKGINIQVSINKSPVQFRSMSNHLDWIDHLNELGVKGSSLVIEITESLLIDNTQTVKNQLLDFRDNGIQVAIDDFGTGYSSLSYLNKLDIDYLKIDKSFISHLAPGSNELILCKAIIVMAHQLGLKVIAEGIETEEQKQLLINAYCDFGQGFLFSKPVPEEDFEKLLDRK
ncbi:MAG: EAL domain-containing protein [Methyloprofundus sp.]|nr:EAL domain-containing protein [Methyloprofundus sp.]